MKFGYKLFKYLDNLKKKNKLYYRDFAKSIGVHPSTINKYIHHGGKPSYMIAQKICYATNSHFSMEEMGFPTKVDY